MLRPVRTAFTLVELLVVITIIGILIALLLPAVQAAREAARRMQCQNNLKQVGLAILNYENAMGFFPSGGIPSPKGGFGVSWMVTILPGLEQSGIYNNFDLAGKYYPDTGLVHGPTSWGPAANAHNGKLVQGVGIDAFYCPSSSVPRWQMQWASPPFPPGVQAPFYTAIAGAVSVIPGTPDSPPVFEDSDGQHSIRGVFQPNRFIAAADIRDGLSNTMMVGEQSDSCLTSSGKECYCGADHGHGFTMGVAPGEHRFFNATTVRYPINSRGWEQPGVGAGYGANMPILSPHTGGAQGLLADGSVQFLAESMTLQMLFNLCNRDDGRVVQAF